MTWERSDKISAAALCVAMLALMFQAAPTALDWINPPRTCDDPSGLTPAKALSASSASELESQGRFSYEAGNAIDGDKTTAWIPAGRNGGVGTQLVVHFGAPTHVRLLCAVNGYAKDPETYLENGRVRDLTVTSDRGSATGALRDLTVETSGNFQRLPLDQGETSSITITINTYYAGLWTGGPDSYDTAISELVAYVEAG